MPGMPGAGAAPAPRYKSAAQLLNFHPLNFLGFCAEGVHKVCSVKKV